MEPVLARKNADGPPFSSETTSKRCGFGIVWKFIPQWVYFLSFEAYTKNSLQRAILTNYFARSSRPLVHAKLGTDCRVEHWGMTGPPRAKGTLVLGPSQSQLDAAATLPGTDSAPKEINYLKNVSSWRLPSLTRTSWTTTGVSPPLTRSLRPPTTPPSRTPTRRARGPASCRTTAVLPWRRRPSA